MKKVVLLSCLLVNLTHAEAPSSVIIDGVEYVPKTNGTETYTIPKSSLQGMEECWYEKVPIYGASQADNTPDVGGAIVGGIIGGVIGHQFGKASGNTAATITGAAIGTALGASSDNTPSEPQYQLIRKCHTIR